MRKLFTMVLILTSSAVFAEGYQVNLQSARQAGMAHTGTAQKLGAESMHFNPAGLVFMDKTVDVSLGMSAVASKVKFQDGDYTAFTHNPVSTPLFAYVGLKAIPDIMAIGLAVTTPYGSSLDWGSTWKGASAVQNISLQSFVFQPTVSLALLDNLSIGAGLMIASGHFNLSKAVLPAGYLAPALGEKYNDVIPVSVELEGRSSVKFGYNLGIMYQPCKKVILGVSYRSKVKMTVNDGEASLHYANIAVQQALFQSGQVSLLDNGSFSASLPLPSNLNAGVTYMPADRWKVAFDLQYVGWKAYDFLDVDFKENMLNNNDQHLEKNYKNTFIYRLGAEYKACKALDVRLGAYFDETPVRNNLYNPETPGANKLGVTTGASYRPVKNMTVDLGLTYIRGFMRDGSYPLVAPATGTFAGEYSSNAFMASVGVSFGF